MLDAVARGRQYLPIPPTPAYLLGFSCASTAGQALAVSPAPTAAPTAIAATEGPADIDIARHVTGWRLTQETRAQNALDDVRAISLSLPQRRRGTVHAIRLLAAPFSVEAGSLQSFPCSAQVEPFCP